MGLKAMQGGLLTALFILVLLLQEGRSLDIVVTNGGYSNVVVAIGDDLHENSCAIYVANIKALISSASPVLYSATEERLFFSSITILIPDNWKSCGSLEIDPNVDQLTFEDSHIRVHTPHPFFGNNPWTQQPRGCGDPGEYIYFSSDFLSEESPTWGSQGSVFVHEWAKFRWGVFEEYGHVGDSIFPSAYHTTATDWQPNYCTDGAVNVQYRSCDLDTPEADCTFTPNIEQRENITSSLLATPFIATVRTFCDDANHVPTAPTKHNLLCNKRSTWDVISKHPDISTTASGDFQGNISYSIQHSTTDPSSDRFVFLLDVTEKMGPKGLFHRWEYLRDAVRQFIMTKAADGSQVAVISFGSSVAPHDLVTLNATNRKELSDLVKENPGPDAYKNLSLAIRIAANVLGESGKIILITENLENHVEDRMALVESANGLPVQPILYPADPGVSTDLYWPVAEMNDLEPQVVNNTLVDTSQSVECLIQLTQFIQMACQSAYVEVTSGRSNQTSNVITLVVVDASMYESEFFIEILADGSTINDYFVEGPSATETGSGFEFNQINNVVVYHTAVMPFHATGGGTDMEQRISLKFLVKLEKGPTECLKLFQEVYGEDVMSSIASMAGYGAAGGLCEESLWLLHHNNVPAHTALSNGIYSVIFITPVPFQGIYASIYAVATSVDNQPIFSIDVSASAPLSNLTFTRDPPRAPIIYAMLSDGTHPILFAELIATIRVQGLEDVYSFDLKLWDNGIEGDVTGNDGTYSSYLIGVEREGILTISVSASDNNGTAMKVAAASPASVSAAPIDPDLDLACCGSSLRIPGDLLTSAGTFNFSSSEGIHGQSTGTFPDANAYPPGRVTDLKGVRVDAELTLTFTATGEDFNVGQASSYNVKDVLDPAFILPVNISVDAGTTISTIVSVDCDTNYAFVVEAVDSTQHAGELSNEVHLIYSCSSELNAGAIVGIVLGCVFLVIILVVLVCAIFKRDKVKESKLGFICKCACCKCCRKKVDSNEDKKRSHLVTSRIKNNIDTRNRTPQIDGSGHISSSNAPVPIRGIGDVLRRHDMVQMARSVSDIGSQSDSGLNVGVNELRDDSSVAYSVPSSHNPRYNPHNQVGIPPQRHDQFHHHYGEHDNYAYNDSESGTFKTSHPTGANKKPILPPTQRRNMTQV
ncbi:calcium-activated chloride channel regulator 1-like [Macrobrachium rosenbergii]|uniref:calcium-activated chloride channel regulator 1-like n=1 Tax=Macrobrachium rosenbergii TaxID=79674 RepID=UPI0034D6720B